MDATIEEVQTLMQGIAEKNREQITKETQPLKDALVSQGEALRSLGSASGFYAASPALGSIVESQKANIAGLISGERRSVKFNVPLTVNKTLVTRASVSGSTLAMRLPDVAQIAYPATVLSDLFNHSQVSANSGGLIRYVDQLAVTRGAASVAEGAQKPESAITWIERSVKIEKVADSIPITKEMLADVAFVEGEIRRLLQTNLSLKVDDLLYDGDGVTPNIKGVYTSAPTFVTTPYADTIEGANLYDLMAVVAADISADRSAKYRANVVLLNPADALRLKLYKTTQGNYLVGPFGADGLRIVESSQVTPNTMLVGDFRYGTIYDLEDVVIEMGWINDQFIKNCITILAEQRLALLIRVADEPAFRKVTNITTALADLETP